MRMKDTACVRAVSRDDLRAGAELLGNLQATVPV